MGTRTESGSRWWGFFLGLAEACQSWEPSALIHLLFVLVKETLFGGVASHVRVFDTFSFFHLVLFSSCRIHPQINVVVETTSQKSRRVEH